MPRYGGHSMSDPGTTYRSREEIQHMRSTSDPITGLKQIILDNNILSEQDLKAIDKEVRKTVTAAEKEAAESPEPPMEEFWTHVYVEGTEPDRIRGRVPSETHYYR